MHINLKARAQVEADLRLGIRRGEFKPYFQPIVKLPSKEVVGFEVLARWNHPIKGLITPDFFIPVAEETAMIADLFYSILHQACSDARNWPPHLHISVNVAPQQLQDPRLPERILDILTRTGFSPSRLEIEITETTPINDLEAARSALTSLKNLGVKIALDDFGTGYSNLYLLKELHFDKLKIDRSYVTSLSQGSEQAKFVELLHSPRHEFEHANDGGGNRNVVESRMVIGARLHVRPGPFVRTPDAEGSRRPLPERRKDNGPHRGVDRARVGGLSRSRSAAPWSSGRDPTSTAAIVRRQRL